MRKALGFQEPPAHLMGNIEVEVGSLAPVHAPVHDEGLAPLGALDLDALPCKPHGCAHALALQQPTHQRTLLILLESEAFHLCAGTGVSALLLQVKLSAAPARWRCSSLLTRALFWTSLRPPCILPSIWVQAPVFGAVCCRQFCAWFGLI